MTAPVHGRLSRRQQLNFLLTNRIPRYWLTLLVGRISRARHPLLRVPAMWLWRLFSDLDLREARQQRFASMHDCFTRELRAGARPVDGDPRVLVSPCDAIVGAAGQVTAGMVLQTKGFPYPLADLLGDEQLAARYERGTYVTLRLTASMYHRFHAPDACRVRQVNYISGDTWNVNPIALRCIERLFCKNERAAIQCQLENGDHLLTLVPVAAILVASIRLQFLDVRLHLRYRGPNVIACDARLQRGQQMGWFEHGSTIIVFTPAGFALCPQWKEGDVVRMGQPLLQVPAAQCAAVDFLQPPAGEASA